MKSEYYRKKVETAQDDAQFEQALRKQIGYTAGSEYFDYRDPLYHISESFQKTFDMAGMRLGEQLNDEADPHVQSARAPEQARENQFVAQTSMDKYYMPSPLHRDDHFLSRFSEVAFNRGTLASAVFRGTGQMMFFTCLKRTIGQSQPKSDRQRMLFEGASVKKNLTAHPNKAVFNRDTVDSALGLVADVTRDARRNVEAFTSMAEGKNILPDNSGRNTLRLVYPFLSDESDRALIEQYRAKLAELKNVPGMESRASILRRAIAKTEALIERKRLMKYMFTTQLRTISDNARGAAAVFSSPGFSEAVYQKLTEDTPDGGAGGDDADAPEPDGAE